MTNNYSRRIGRTGIAGCLVVSCQVCKSENCAFKFISEVGEEEPQFLLPVPYPILYSALIFLACCVTDFPPLYQPRQWEEQKLAHHEMGGGF